MYMKAIQWLDIRVLHVFLTWSCWMSNVNANDLPSKQWSQAPRLNPRQTPTDANAYFNITEMA